MLGKAEIMKLGSSVRKWPFFVYSRELWLVIIQFQIIYQASLFY